MFSSSEERDAWKTVRGYVYQVELTVERWLDLQEGQVLELERGEDIDRVLPSLLTGEEQSRILEQVKHRDATLTLRSPGAFSSLAHAVEHLAKNEGLDLLFRYTTNSAVATEHPSPMADRTPLIDVWEKLRLGQLDGDERSTALNAIRETLRNAPPPGDLNKRVLRRFLLVLRLASDRALLAFVRRFEWSTGKTEAREMQGSLVRRLLSTGPAVDEIQAQEQYHALFVHVLKLLCERGLKRLTCEDRRRLLLSPTLSQTDHELLVRLHTFQAKLAACVEQLKAQQQKLEVVQGQFRQDLDRLVAVDAQSIRLGYTRFTPSLDVPPLVAAASPRAGTVVKIGRLVDAHAWTAIYGSAGLGKTQLAVLLAQHDGNCAGWIGMRGLSAATAGDVLDQACRALADGLQPDPSRLTWYGNICARLGRGALLVLDDMPRLLPGDSLCPQLIQLARACSTHGVHILSTSAHRLPTSIGEVLDRALLEQVVPALTDSEAREILKAHGAPDALLQFNTVRFVNVTARANPTLLAAAARYLRDRGWQLNDVEFDALMRANYAESMNEETIARLLQSVEDAESRELLYRMNLVLGGLTVGVTQCLAQVEPLIARPNERLDALAGLWIQREAAGRLVVSPLVQMLGCDQVLPPVRKECYRALAQERIKRGSGTQFDIRDIVFYLHCAEEHEHAGTFLYLGLSELLSLEPSVPDGALLIMWWGLPLPVQMSLRVRLLVRAVQIAVAAHRSRDIGIVIADVEALVSQAGVPEALSVLALSVNAGQPMAMRDFGLATRCFARAMELLAQGGMKDVSPEQLPQLGSAESLIWTYHPRGSETNIRDWMSMVGRLTPAQRQVAFSNGFAPFGCLDVCEQVWLETSNSSDPDWANTLSLLREVGAFARQYAIELLWASAIRGQILVLSRALKELDQAEQLATEVIGIASEDPWVRFLITDTIGRELSVAARHQAAVSWLSQALSCEGDDLTPFRMETLLFAGRSVAAGDPPRAVEYVRQGVQLALGTPGTPDRFRVRALGELALALWLAGSIAAAYEPLDQAAELLFACREDTTDWQSLFAFFGHVAGYFASVITTGEPPVSTPGEEPQVLPERGTFLVSSGARAAFYRAEHEYAIPAQLSMFATAIGNTERAASWSLRGVDLARASGQTWALGKLGWEAIADQLAGDRYVEALEVARDAGPAIIAGAKWYRQGGSPLDPEFDVGNVLGPKPGENWSQVEAFSAMMCLVPATMRLAVLALTDPESCRKHAAELAGLCRQTAGQAATPVLWTTAAKILDQSFIHPLAGSLLVDEGNQYLDDDLKALRVLAYVGASLQGDLRPADVLRAQLAMLPYLLQWFKKALGIQERILLPYVLAVWSKRLEGNRLSFSRPAAAEAEMARAVQQAGQVSACLTVTTILRTISSALGVPFPRGLD